MSSYFTVPFWRAPGDPAIKTFFQTVTAAAVVGASGDYLNIGTVDWKFVLSVGLGAVFLSVGTSFSNADFVAGPTPARITILPVDPPA